MTRPTVTRFTPADQRRFARRSGDHNPIHLDASAARRIVAGEPIVHGVHLLLRMLEAHFGARRATVRQRVSISIAFLQPAIVGERIRFARDSEGRLTAETADGGATLAVATIARIEGDGASVGRRSDRARAAKPPRTPMIRTAADIDGAAGAIALPPAAPLARAFPRTARALGAEVVAAVAGLSALVGMECPGRDSLLCASIAGSAW